MAERLFKLGHYCSSEWREHSHAPVFRREATAGGGERLVAGVPSGDSAIFASLVTTVQPPYFLLYILHTPRGEGEPGRYQSPEIGLDDFQRFLQGFSAFLAGDSRFDLWAHSSTDEATIVWDRHNLLYAYGPLDKFEGALRNAGFEDGEPTLAFAHRHYYRAEFDKQAAELLAAFDWHRTPLRPEDEQHV